MFDKLYEEFFFGMNVVNKTIPRVERTLFNDKKNYFQQHLE
jgi:hypothetical protein